MQLEVPIQTHTENIFRAHYGRDDGSLVGKILKDLLKISPMLRSQYISKNEHDEGDESKKIKLRNCQSQYIYLIEWIAINHLLWIRDLNKLIAVNIHVLHRFNAIYQCGFINFDLLIINLIVFN